MSYEDMFTEAEIDEMDYDFCALCGGKVGVYFWREHMEHHNCVLLESPKNQDGTWKSQNEYVYDAQLRAETGI